MDADAEGNPDEVVDALYAHRPAGFTAARDAAAARLGAAGDAAGAKRVAALRRPTLAAWASNTLVRAAPEETERFLRLGQALREAHRSLDGERLRELAHEQHVVIGALAREAKRLAEEAGAPVSEAVVREVERILHAALADPEAARDWASARLVRAPEAEPAFPPADPAAVAAARRPAARPTGPGPGARTERARGGGTPEAASVEPPDATARLAREAARDAVAREEELRLADAARQRAAERAAAADAEVTRLERSAERARAERDLAHEALTGAEARHREAARAAREARRAATTAGRRRKRT